MMLYNYHPVARFLILSIAVCIHASSLTESKNIQQPPQSALILSKLSAGSPFNSSPGLLSLPSLGADQLAQTTLKQQTQPSSNGKDAAIGGDALTTSLSESGSVVMPTGAVNQQWAAQTSETVSGLPASAANEDPLTHLDYSSIMDEVLNKPTANFVYFNANFNECRHCQKFLSVWKELAGDIRWWRNMIRLFTINCSEDDNIYMCRRAGVSQLPQVKYYWIQSGSLDQDGQRLRILGKSVHAMRHLIVDRVLESYAEHNKLLAQRTQSGASSGASSAGAASGLVQQASVMNPLLAMLKPMMGQLLGNSGGTAAGGGLGGAIGLMNMLAGGGQPTASAGSLFGSSTKSAGALVGARNPLLGLLSSLGQLTGGLGDTMRRSLNLKPLPGNWAELEPIDVKDSSQLLAELPFETRANRSTGALLIMETPEFLYTGQELLLDLNPYSNKTYMRRVRDPRSLFSKNLTRRDDVQAPTLIWVSPQRESRLIMSAPKYSNDEDLRRVFVKAFERKQTKYPVKRSWSVSRAVITKAPEEDEELLGRVHGLYMQDLVNALRISLMEQVFRISDLNEDQYNSLVKYVYTLINYFPFANDDQLKFIRRLHTWLQNQVSPLDMNEYKKQFHDIDESFPKGAWLACRRLSNIKLVSSSQHKGRASLFENPHQLGRVVSNITKFLRGQQQQVSKLKNLFTAFAGASGAAPQPSTQTPHLFSMTFGNSSTTQTPHSLSSQHSSPDNEGGSQQDSPLEHIFKSLTSGSLGSDSSILKLISSALTGGASSAGQQSKFVREYPCGAWKLAHVLVVNEYLKESPRKDVHHIVLHSLYQYMLHFYACNTCGNRVSDVANEFRLDLNEQLHDQWDSVLLLWKLHNRVSKRLEAEFRPGSPPKIQFPTEQLCPKCRTERAPNEPAISLSIGWHEKQVLNFLVHHYRPQSIENGSGNSSTTSSASSTLYINQWLIKLTVFWTLLKMVVAMATQPQATSLPIRCTTNSNSNSLISLPSELHVDLRFFLTQASYVT